VRRHRAPLPRNSCPIIIPDAAAKVARTSAGDHQAEFLTPFE
jgi:hypothetical protein